MPVFAITRTEKLKTWESIKGSMDHTLRAANIDKTHLNKSPKFKNEILFGDPNWVEKFQEQVAQMHLPKLKQGYTHTLAREFFFGISPEWVKGKTKKDLDAWAQANVQFLKDRFGEERVQFAYLHLDEQTPHIAAYIVPTKVQTSKARAGQITLSDRAIGLGGGKDELVQLQDDYANAMKRFGLERGISGSTAEHKTKAQWVREQKKIDKLAQEEKAKIKAPKPREATVRDRVHIEEYAQEISQTTTESILSQVTDYTRLYVQTTSNLAMSERERKSLKGKLAKLEPAIQLVEEFLSILLNKKINLRVPAHWEEATNALKVLLRAAKPPQAPTPLPTLEKTHQTPENGARWGTPVPSALKPSTKGGSRGVLPPLETQRQRPRA
jgi:hypothetical protein